MTILPLRAEFIRTDMGEYVLSVRDLHVGTAFGGVDFDVKRGSIVALVGDGAPEALASIAGVRPAVHGSVRFLGYEVVRRSTDRLARSGLVYVGEPAPFARMSVLDTVIVGALARTRSVEKATRTARELLDLFALTPYAERVGVNLPPREGRRLAIARALATAPIVLLVAGACAGNRDERALDAVIARAVAARGTTLVLGESQGDLAELADVVIERGPRIP